MNYVQKYKYDIVIVIYSSLYASTLLVTFTIYFVFIGHNILPNIIPTQLPVKRIPMEIVISQNSNNFA